MGFNSTVLVINDGLDQIEKDDEFGKKVGDGIRRLGPTMGKGIEISSGNHANPAKVLETHHADETAIIAIGQNCGTVLFRLWGCHHKEEDKLRLVKEMANELGYRLVIKNRR